MKKKLAFLCVLLAVAAVVVAAALWRGAGAEIAAQSVRRASLAAELDTTRTSLRKASLRFQGFQRGMDAVPDSVRLATAGATMQQSNVYRKNIERLEGEERRILTMLRKTEAQVAEITASRRRSALPLAVLAAIFSAAGAVLFAAERSRRVAS